MPIHFNKNAKGEHIGKLRVEVRGKGRRLRARVNTLAEAIEKEKEFRAQLSSEETLGIKKIDDPGRPDNLLEQINALVPMLWSVSEDLNVISARLKDIAEFLGPPPPDLHG